MEWLCTAVCRRTSSCHWLRRAYQGCARPHRARLGGSGLSMGPGWGSRDPPAASGARRGGTESPVPPWSPAGGTGSPLSRHRAQHGGTGTPSHTHLPIAPGRGGAGTPTDPHPSVGPGLRRRPSRAGSARALPGLGLLLFHSGSCSRTAAYGSGTSNEPHPCSPARPESTALLSRADPQWRMRGVGLFPPGRAFPPCYRVGFRCGGLFFVQEWL